MAIKKRRASCILAIACALMVYLWIDNDATTTLTSYSVANYNVENNNIPHHRQLDTPNNNNILSLFHDQHITGGCPYQPPHLNQNDEEFWSTMPVYHAEQEFMAARPTNFIHLPSFDDDENKTIGGLALFKNAFLKGPGKDKTGPAIYDCANSIYVPGGCSPNVKSPIEFKNVNRVDSTTYMALKDGVTIYLGQLFDNAYWHSQVEILPKLVYLLPYLQQSQNWKSVTILFPKAISEARIDLLSKLVGLGSGIERVPFHESKTYLVPKLIVPTATRCGFAQPKAIEKFQQMMNERAPSLLAEELKALRSDHRILTNTKVAPRRPLILVQKRLGTRKLLNHDDLMSALQSRFGSKAAILVFQGNETPSQTAALHRLASLIIAPHGAGLANLIYCRRHRTAVIELHPPKGNVGKDKDINHCHEATACAAGLRYSMMVSGGSGGFGDFEMNVEDVLGEVERALEWLGHAGDGGEGMEAAEEAISPI